MATGFDWKHLVTGTWPSWYERRLTLSLFAAGVLVLIHCFTQSMSPQMQRNTRLQKPWTFRVDLNTATRSELEMLPGVGPRMAAQMIEFKNGLPNRRFTEVEQLLQIKGLGPLTLEKLRKHLVLTDDL